MRNDLMNGKLTREELGRRPLEQTWWPWPLSSGTVYRLPSTPSKRIMWSISVVGLLLFALMLYDFASSVIPKVVSIVHLAQWVQRWPTTTATITESSTVRSDNSSKVQYLPAIAFTYADPDHPGQTLAARTFQVVSLPTPWKWACDAVVARFPVGSSHPCYVDPQHPSDAILDRTQLPRTGLLILLLAASMAVAVLAGLSTMFLTRGQPPRRFAWRGDEAYPLALFGFWDRSDWWLIGALSLLGAMLVTGMVGLVGMNLVMVPMWCIAVSASAIAWQVVFIVIDGWCLRRDLRRRPTVVIDTLPMAGGMLSARWTIPAAFGPVRRVAIDVRGLTSPALTAAGRKTFPSGEALARFDLGDAASPTDCAGTVAWPIPTDVRPNLDLERFHLGWDLCITIYDDRDRPRVYAFPFRISAPTVAASLVIA